MKMQNLPLILQQREKTKIIKILMKMCVNIIFKIFRFIFFCLFQGALKESFEADKLSKIIFTITSILHYSNMLLFN